ncbi:MAG TPA: RNA methyltransferase [Lentimicrobium sp.]|nr:RNA methyltransferase [Lentimicrobium sp.]
MKKLSMEELERLTITQFKESDKIPVTIVLDNIRSQHNIGSIFRTADAFRIECIHLCGITATPPNREIQKTALGATESVEWSYFSSTMGSINELKRKGYVIIAVEQADESIDITEVEVVKDKKIALVFGNEVHGVNEEVMNFCDMCIEIPQFGTKHSLNVSVSAGIIIWEIFKKVYR